MNERGKEPSNEQSAIEKTDSPTTEEKLTSDLKALGIRPGMTLLVHTSLSSLGWVCGGPIAVIGALQRAVTRSGTLVMPTQSGDLSDPANWGNPPVPEGWWVEIRASMPAFDPRLTPTRGMGVVAELFRTYPGAVRSDHPTASFAALGPQAKTITSEQHLEDPFGSASPLVKLYALEASILLLGVGHSSNTTLHLAERKGLGGTQAQVKTGAPITVRGRREWVSFSEPDISSHDFSAVGEVFERETAQTRSGRVGHAEARLIPVRPLVDYATAWFRVHRQA